MSSYKIKIYDKHKWSKSRDKGYFLIKTSKGVYDISIQNIEIIRRG